MKTFLKLEIRALVAQITKIDNTVLSKRQSKELKNSSVYKSCIRLWSLQPNRNFSFEVISGAWNNCPSNVFFAF